MAKSEAQNFTKKRDEELAGDNLGQDKRDVIASKFRQTSMETNPLILPMLLKVCGKPKLILFDPGGSYYLLFDGVINDVYSILRHEGNINASWRVLNKDTTLDKQNGLDTLVKLHKSGVVDWDIVDDKWVQVSFAEFFNSGVKWKNGADWLSQTHNGLKEVGISMEVKAPILTYFQQHIFDLERQFSCGTQEYKAHMDQFLRVSDTFLELDRSYQVVIEEITKRMGVGMTSQWNRTSIMAFKVANTITTVDRRDELKLSILPEFYGKPKLHLFDLGGSTCAWETWVNLPSILYRGPLILNNQIVPGILIRDGVIEAGLLSRHVRQYVHTFLKGMRDVLCPLKTIAKGFMVASGKSFVLTVFRVRNDAESVVIGALMNPFVPKM